MTQEIVFVDHADTDAGREKLRRLKARRFNCLVFNISDDNLHAERGDLREINDKIRHKVERDVVPEMKRLVGAGDIVVITSDHGFVELDDQQKISLDTRGAEAHVFYRYLNDLDHPAGLVVPYSGKRGVGRVTVLIGRGWFDRHLFEPLPAELRHDTAFLDRIHAYLPGWEIPKIAQANYATGYGFISD
jgi:hypothetical protein